MRRKCAARFATLATAGSVAIVAAPGSGGTPTVGGAFSGEDGALTFVRGTDLWRAETDGTGLKRLTFSSDEATEFGPVWSPDGRRIAFFASTARFVGGQISVVPGHGQSEVRRRTGDRGGENDSPAWSPDGSRLVFVAKAPGRRTPWRLDVMNANGKERRTLVRVGRFASDPAWSPDGTQIAYAINHQLYVTSSKGGRRGRRLTSGDAPNWSPDGRRIAFRRELRAFVVDADGTGERALVPEVELELQAGPVWSPSGRSLALAIDAGEMCGNTRDFEGVIAIVNEAGTGLRLPFGCITEYHAAPDWQPVCTIYGTDEDDILNGTPGPDVICALRGDDRIAAYEGDDVIIGGDGDDTIYGGPGTDRLFGSAGRDRLLGSGDAASDIVNGGPGSDRGVIDSGLDRPWELESVIGR